MDNRNAELAKIHIGKDQLDMDDHAYQDMLWTLCRVHSSKDLDSHGRHEVIKYLERCGAKFIKRPRSKRAPGAATEAEIAKIEALWRLLSDAGVVRDGSARALRSWLQKATRSHHPRRLGYSAPYFLPHEVAGHVIEQLKKWCDRTEVKH